MTEAKGCNVQADRATPSVSVLMPTFNQAAFIRRAIESLRANVPGLGACGGRRRLAGRERATACALPRGCADTLRAPPTQPGSGRGAQHRDRPGARPEIYLAYGGVRWNYDVYGPTLQGERPRDRCHGAARPELRHRRLLQGLRRPRRPAPRPPAARPADRQHARRPTSSSTRTSIGLSPSFGARSSGGASALQEPHAELEGATEPPEDRHRWDRGGGHDHLGDVARRV